MAAACSPQRFHTSTAVRLHIVYSIQRKTMSASSFIITKGLASIKEHREARQYAGTRGVSRPLQERIKQFEGQSPDVSLQMVSINHHSRAFMNAPSENKSSSQSVYAKHATGRDMDHHSHSSLGGDYGVVKVKSVPSPIVNDRKPRLWDGTIKTAKTPSLSVVTKPCSWDDLDTVTKQSWEDELAATPTWHPNARRDLSFDEQEKDLSTRDGSSPSRKVYSRMGVMRMPTDHLMDKHLHCKPAAAVHPVTSSPRSASVVCNNNSTVIFAPVLTRPCAAKTSELNFNEIEDSPWNHKDAVSTWRSADSASPSIYPNALDAQMSRIFGSCESEVTAGIGTTDTIESLYVSNEIIIEEQQPAVYCDHEERKALLVADSLSTCASTLTSSSSHEEGGNNTTSAVTDKKLLFQASSKVFGSRKKRVSAVERRKMELEQKWAADRVMPVPSTKVQWALDRQSGTYKKKVVLNYDS